MSKVKNVFTKLGLIEDDVAVTTKAKPTRPTTKATAEPSTDETQFTTPSFSSTVATVDPSITEMLQQSLQENKLSGFDYLKFISAVEKSKVTGVPESARFQMAYNTAQEMGVDKTKLLDSGSHYLDVLKQDEDDFNTDCTQYDKKEVQSREAKIAEIEETAESLKKQMAELAQEHETLTQELATEKSKLETRKASFQATIQTFRSAIESNIQKINQYIQ